MLSLLACGIGWRCVVKIIHSSINIATTLFLAANQMKNLKCALAMLNYSSKAIIVAKPFQTYAYMEVIYTFLHVPSKRLVISSSMLMIPTAWSKLLLYLVICLVRWQRNTFQWCMKSQEITMDKGSSCSMNISYQKCKFFISWHGNLCSEHLWCSALCWGNRQMAFSGKT